MKNDIQATQRSVGSSLRDQLREFNHQRIYKALALVLTAIIILTVGEFFPGHGIPSWSDALTPALSAAEQQVMLSDSDLIVHFIDVGQGDATFIQTNEANILIDAGENGRGRSIVRYLESIGVSSLDWMIATHPHSDHIGGMDDVLRAMSVDNVMLPDISEACITDNSFYTSVMDEIALRDIPVQYVSSGDVVTCGNISMTVLHPSAGEYRSDLNDTSLCIHISCGGHSLLVCGDITYEIEDELLEKNAVPHADIFHVIHHGSALSNTKDFIAATEAKYAVISCGLGNGYGHPHKSVLDDLDSLGIQYFRTDKDGTVVISCRSKGIEASVSD